MKTSYDMAGLKTCGFMLTSCHPLTFYLRLPENIESWEKIPQDLLVDCAQLVKMVRYLGNKKDNLTIIYTPWDNLKKTGDMAVGQVAFQQNSRVIIPFLRTFHIPERVNAIVNRLNKTKVVREVDHEQERVDRIKVESAKRKAAALEKVLASFLTRTSAYFDVSRTEKADAELARQREADKTARSYDNLFTNVGYEDEEDEDGEPKERKTGTELEEDFM
ncbi:hypothetical protein B0J17DRAFT_735977 [Rhizoctonia solani]|nr:hypothetical protein B0J17DRAFT_735977 [Rhizoctonia solani]